MCVYMVCFVMMIILLAVKYDWLPCRSCCCKPTACICCKNCSDDVDIASAPIKGLHVWGGLVINDEFDVSAVAFGTLTKPFAWTEPLKLRFTDDRFDPFDELPLVVLNELVIESFDNPTPGEIDNEPFETEPLPFIVDKMVACICWYFFCSLSRWVSANFTTNGAEHPSMVWLWFSPCNKIRKSLKKFFFLQKM